MSNEHIEKVRQFNEAMGGYNSFWLHNNVRVFYKHAGEDYIRVGGAYIQNGLLELPEDITQEFSAYGILSRKEFIELLEKLSILET